jgi:hypothetical protein
MRSDSRGRGCVNGVPRLSAGAVSDQLAAGWATDPAPAGAVEEVGARRVEAGSSTLTLKNAGLTPSIDADFACVAGTTV